MIWEKLQHVVLLRCIKNKFFFLRPNCPQNIWIFNAQSECDQLLLNYRQIICSFVALAVGRGCTIKIHNGTCRWRHTGAHSFPQNGRRKNLENSTRINFTTARADDVEPTRMTKKKTKSTERNKTEKIMKPKIRKDPSKNQHENKNEIDARIHVENWRETPKLEFSKKSTEKFTRNWTKINRKVHVENQAKNTTGNSCTRTPSNRHKGNIQNNRSHAPPFHPSHAHRTVHYFSILYFLYFPSTFQCFFAAHRLTIAVLGNPFFLRKVLYKNPRIWSPIGTKLLDWAPIISRERIFKINL